MEKIFTNVNYGKYGKDLFLNLTLYLINSEACRVADKWG
jgi:hypothetical protein